MDQHPSKKKTGKMGENLAIALLRKQGYRIVDTNFFASKFGEIDIVAYDGDCLVFVEVKTRRSSEQGLPEDAVVPAKIRKLARTAEFYIMTHNLIDPEYRLDVVALGLNARNEVVYEKHHKNITI